MQNIIRKSIVDKEWVHVGNDHIDRSLFKTPVNADTNKPGTGVLWLSERSSETRCRWFTVLESPYQKVKRAVMINNAKLENGIIKCCMVKISDAANLLDIDTEEQLEGLADIYKQKSDQYDYCLDYTRLSEDYDGIYINCSLSDSFKYFGVDSLIIFNPDIIKSYKPAEVGYEIYEEEYFYEYSFKISKEFDYVPMKDNAHIKQFSLGTGKNNKIR